MILPLAAPGVFTAAILVFIFAWNDFLFAISLTSSDASRTVPAPGLLHRRVVVHQPTGSIAAAAVVVTVPIIIFVLFFAPNRRRLTAGAVRDKEQRQCQR